jgi:hypothetical protein
MERILIFKKTNNKMKKMQVVILTALFLFGLTNLVLAQELIRGGKAKEYVGEFSKKFSAGTYTLQILTRNLPNPSTQAKIDGIVLNAQSGSFRYIRRQDGDHILILLSYKKTPTLKIDGSNVASFEQMVKDNKLVPYVLLDNAGVELAIIYATSNAKIISRQRKSKNVYLQIENPLVKKSIFIRQNENNSK